MLLREYFAEDAIGLDLRATTKDDILQELVKLLKLDAKAEALLLKKLKERESVGSTGIGRGVAIPHCRATAVSRLRVAFGRSQAGVDYKSMDDKPAHLFFLIVAPPLEVSNQYLPVLGKIAQFVKDEDVPKKLMQIGTAQELLELLEEKGV
jgi:mannitol/fructose-specific phosphotransferase system IIA component (Ntr-type)